MSNNPFGKIPGGMGNFFKQAQKAMQDAQNVEAELGQARIEGQSGGGMVKIAVSGKCDVLEVKIAKEAVDPNDIEMLEDLVTAAMREAIEKANRMREERLKSVMPAGMGGPGAGGLF